MALRRKAGKKEKKKVSVIIFRNSKSEFLLLFENLFPLPLFKKFTSKMQRFRKFRKYSLVIEEKGNPIVLPHRHDCFYRLGVHPYWLFSKPIFKLQWNDIFACRVYMHTVCVCTWSMWVSPKFVMAFKFKKIPRASLHVSINLVLTHHFILMLVLKKKSL